MFVSHIAVAGCLIASLAIAVPASAQILTAPYGTPNAATSDGGASSSHSSAASTPSSASSASTTTGASTTSGATTNASSAGAAGTGSGAGGRGGGGGGGGQSGGTTTSSPTRAATVTGSPSLSAGNATSVSTTSNWLVCPTGGPSGQLESAILGGHLTCAP